MQHHKIKVGRVSLAIGFLIGNLSWLFAAAALLLASSPPFHRFHYEMTHALSIGPGILCGGVWLCIRFIIRTLDNDEDALVALAQQWLEVGALVGLTPAWVGVPLELLLAYAGLVILFVLCCTANIRAGTEKEEEEDSA